MSIPHSVVNRLAVCCLVKENPFLHFTDFYSLIRLSEKNKNSYTFICYYRPSKRHKINSSSDTQEESISAPPQTIMDLDQVPNETNLPANGNSLQFSHEGLLSISSSSNGQSLHESGAASSIAPELPVVYAAYGDNPLLTPTRFRAASNSSEIHLAPSKMLLYIYRI